MFYRIPRPCIVFGLLLSLLAVTPASAEISPGKKQAIDQLIEVTGLKSVMEQMMDQMLATMQQQNPEIPPSLMERFSAKMNVDEMIELIIPIYDKYYSTEDLEAINAFYASEVGQRVIKTLPLVMQESVTAGQAWGMNIAEEIMTEMKAEAETGP